MATQAKGSVEGLKQREEALCVLWTSKMLLLSFLDPGWLMRVLGPIVQVAALSMLYLRQDAPLRRRIAT